MVSRGRESHPKKARTYQIVKGVSVGEIDPIDLFTMLDIPCCTTKILNGHDMKAEKKNQGIYGQVKATVIMCRLGTGGNEEM